MKDKEKQIEEMAEDIRNELQYDIEDRSVDAYDTAFRLKMKGWIKPDKDSVVLSREEYAEYVELRNSEVAELVKENKVLEKQCLDWVKLYHKQLTKTKEASKETAEKILREIAHIKVRGNNLEDYIVAVKVVDKIDELAKQFGVEIKEE